MEGLIIEAVLGMLAEGTGVAELSMEAVAARAGVGKATIYRRWASKDALIVDAIAVLKGPIPQPLGRSVREDLVAMLGSVGRVHDSRAGKILSCLMPQVHRNDDLLRRYQEIVEPRREVVREILRRGVARGELRADLDIELTLTMLTSPMVLQTNMRSNPRLDPQELPERIVDLLLAGIARGPDASPTPPA